jgi:hypothetical protein
MVTSARKNATCNKLILALQISGLDHPAKKDLQEYPINLRPVEKFVMITSVYQSGATK